MVKNLVDKAKRYVAEAQLAGYGPISNGIPEVICGSGDTDVDITRPIRKARS